MAASYWRRPLDAAGHARNRAIGRLRAPVERTFAILKRWYGYRRVRYRSLVRNALQLQLLACCHEPAPRPRAERLTAKPPPTHDRRRRRRSLNPSRTSGFAPPRSLPAQRDSGAGAPPATSNTRS